MVLITGKDNDNLRNFGQGVSKWVSQGLLFLTFNSETKPYPFSEWPETEATESYVAPEVEPKPAETQAQSEPVADKESPAEAPIITEPAVAEPAGENSEGGEAEVQLDDDFTDSSKPESDIPSFTGDSEDPNVNKNTGKAD